MHQKTNNLVLPEHYDTGYYGSAYLPAQVIKSSLGRYVFASQFTNGKVVLEIGCANGQGVSFLMSKGTKQIFAGDISKEAVDFAKTHYQRDGLSFSVMDGLNLDFPDGFFDVVIAFEVIEHLNDYKDFAGECQRVLKAGGVFICSTPNKATCSPNSEKTLWPAHVKEFYPDEFCNILSANFKLVDLFGYHPVSPKMRLLVGKIGCGAKPRIYYFLKPFVLKLLNPVLKYIYPSLHHVRMQDVKDTDVEKMILKDRDYQPFPMKKNILSCFDMIAVAKK